jgi:membrane associated rhomboid family serine protease
VFVRVEQRRKPHLPWATIAIIGSCVLVSLWLAGLPPGEHLRLLRHWGTVPAKLLDPQAPTFLQLFEQRGLRLVTALFIHADWLHLAGNLLFLMIFGLPAERALGSWRFVALFVVGGALANLIGALTLASANEPIVGSSGGVSAVVGAYLALFPRARLGLVIPLGAFLEFVRVPAPLLIGFWILLQVLFTFVGPAFGAVVWWTHIAGFVVGILYALVARSTVERRLRP